MLSYCTRAVLAWLPGVAGFIWILFTQLCSEVRRPSGTTEVAVSLYMCMTIGTRHYRYHLGSIALGSFIIAVIQFIRALLEYVDRQMKAANPGNVVMNYLMACVK